MRIGKGRTRLGAGVQAFLIAFVLVLAGCGQDDARVSDRTPAGAEPGAKGTSLRVQIDRLKVEALSTPTTLENVEGRVHVVWAWANQMSMASRGLQYAPNLPLIIRTLSAELEGTDYLSEAFRPYLNVPEETQQERRNARMRRLMKNLDFYIAELTQREDAPESFGELRADQRGPFVAHSFQTIRQTWTVGSAGLTQGAYFLLGMHDNVSQGELQATDPAGDNYVSIESDRAGVEFRPTKIGKFGMHGGDLRNTKDVVSFVLEAGALEPGDLVTLTYGDRSGGSKGFQIMSVSNDAYRLPVYLSFDGNPLSNYQLTPQHFEVVGKPVRDVAGFVPSVVGVDEPFELTVRSEDEFFNLATGEVPGYDLFINDEKVGEVLPSREALATVADLRIGSPGYYFIRIVSKDGSHEGESNPLHVVDGPKQRIFWGETHGHSGFAEGQGTPEGYFEFARDESKLDFISLSEHDLWLDDGEWEYLRDAARAFNADGKFITYVGYEWTANKGQGGHHNILFRNTENVARVPTQMFPTLQLLYAGLKKRYPDEDVLSIPHAHQTGYWLLSDAGIETLVEIHSLHGFFEWFGQAYIDAGHRVGFIAASDDHLGHPGYNVVRPSRTVHRSGLAAVIAPSRTRDGLFNAMKDRHAYATTVDRILLDVDLNGVGMGDVLSTSEDRTIQIETMGTAAIDSITVVKNGKTFWQENYRLDPTLSAQQTVEVAFASPSNPVGMLPDNPRPSRVWTGRLTVEDATLIGFEESWANPHFAETRVDDENPNLIHFTTWTRGEARRLALHLEGVSRETQVLIELDAHKEVPTAPATLRPAQLIAGTSLAFDFDELPGGVFEHVLQVDEYQDVVSLKLIHGDAPRMQRAVVTDSEPVKKGDYYYVRVDQANSGMAWSSPIFIEPMK